MDGLEDKLGAILSSPEAMEQIMALAGSIAGNFQGQPAQPETQTPEPENTGLGSLLAGFDPAMLTKLLPLVQQYQSGGGEREALLLALKPFLKQETQEKMEKAIRITRLSRVIRTSMGLFKGGLDV